MTTYNIEAEDMSLWNYEVVQGDQASSGELVKSTGLNQWGGLDTTFDGDAGTYDLSVLVQDEADGQSQIWVRVNGVDVAMVTLDQDSDGWGSDDGGFSTVTVSGLELQPGDIVSLVTYSEGGEWVRIDKLVIENDVVPVESDCIVIEAEDMSLWNYEVVQGDQASSGELVKSTGLNQWGGLETTFDGDAGTYDLSLLVQDEADGQSQIWVRVNGVDVAMVTLDQDSDGWGSDDGGFSTVTVSGLELQPGDIVSLVTYSECGEWVRIDKLELKPIITVNNAPEAVDDALVTDENTTITANLLDNDSDADGDAISVTAIEGGTVGEAFEITTTNGYTGQITVQSDGTFTFDPDDNFKALAQGEQDSFQLTYTITDDPTAAIKHNLMFVLDISNSTIGAGGGDDVFDGADVGDVNGDALSNTVLDAEIAAVLAAVQNLIDQGVDPSDIDVGIATFSGVAAGFASVDAETLGTFALNDGGLAAALQSIQSGGWTNYEAGLQQAENWFAGQAGDGAQNKLVFLSDGRPIVGYDYNAGQYITQTNADYGDEVSRIANDYGAEIYGIGVGANSDLDYLNDLDNTGGAERVLDAATLNVVVENAVALPASDTATVTVTINGLNGGPDALNDSLTVFENETGSINILTNDSDPDGDAISIVDVAGNQVGDSFQVMTADGRTGTVTVQADGTLTFDPGAGFEDLNNTETDSFQLTYTITDGSETTSDRTVDFEGLARGTIVSDQIAGVTVSAFRNGQDASAPNMAMIFDADSPTGGDTDLAVAGVGKLLIISEDGDSSDPDDNAGGGTFIFDFDAPTTVNGLTFVDIDHAETPPKIALFDENGALIAELDGIFTGNGQKGDFAIDTAGVSRMEITLTGSGGVNDLDFTETVMTEGLTDTATVTVTVNGIGQPVDALDDAFSIAEEEDISANLLDNDTPNDGTLTVVGVAEDGTAQTVGQAFTVTTDGGREGTVTLDADGNFTFDGGDNFIELGQGETDTVDITYTVEGEATAGEVPKHNILFVIDVSGSTSPAEFGGSAVGDQNGDGVSNSVLDAEISAYKELSQKIADSGLSMDKVDIGLISFSSTGATQFLGTFDAGSGSLDTALENLTDGGLTNFEEPLQVGIQWFEDQAATTDDKNIVYFLSDGMQNTGGTFDDEAGELASRFGAELNAVGVGNGAVLSQLEQIDNTGGAEIVTTTDALTAALVDNAPEVPGDQDTATVTITINGIGVSAGDDALQTDEETASTIDILANDAAPAGLGLCVIDVAGDVASGANVGSAFMVTTAAGRQGMVTVMEDGSFMFDPEDGFVSLSATETDSFSLNYTMAAGAMFGELSYELYDGTPAGNTVANIPLSGAVASGSVDNLDTAALAVAATGDATTYAVRYTGVLTIEEAGDYDFNLGSDDGSALFIDGVQVIDNDGLHGIVNVPGSANLSAGQHTIEILFFQNGGGAGLSLDYSGIDTGGVAASIFPAAASQPFETAEATVEVTVLGLDSAPVAVDDVLVTDEDTAATINILMNDSDPEDDVLTVVSIEGGTVGIPMSVTTADNRTGSVTVLADGTFSFDPETGFDDLAQGASDTVTLTYTATDGTVADTATVTITVNGLNAAPVAVNDTLTTTEDTAASINILANDIDPDSDALEIVEINGFAVGETFSVSTTSNRTGTVTVESNGTLTFTPDQSFQDLNDGDSDTLELTYSITDGQFTNDATVTVLVNGTGSANGRVTIQGSIAASVSGQSHVAVVLDASVFTTGFAAGLTITDLDNDGNVGAVMDLMLQKVLDLANALNADDKITLIPSGAGDVDLDTIALTFTVAQIKDAADPSTPSTPQALFNPLVSTYFGNDIAIDLPQALEKAEEVLTSIGADQNQVVVMTSTDTLDQSGSVAASQSLVANANATIDVLYIEAGAAANLSNLNAIDTENGVDVDTQYNFGLATLIDPSPSVLANVEAFAVLVDGQKVLGIDESALTVNSTNDGFDFTGEVDLNGQSGEIDIIVAIDTDLDATTAAEVFTLSDTLSSIDRTVENDDTFVFDFA